MTNVSFINGMNAALSLSSLSSQACSGDVNFLTSQADPGVTERTLMTLSDVTFTDCDVSFSVIQSIGTKTDFILPLVNSLTVLNSQMSLMFDSDSNITADSVFWDDG